GEWAVGEEREAVVDHVVREDGAVGILRGLRRIETQHVGQYAFLVDRSNRFLARVTSSVAHQMHELIEPALRSFTGSLALYSSFVSSVLKKLLTLGCPA